MERESLTPFSALHSSNTDPGTVCVMCDLFLVHRMIGVSVFYVCGLCVVVGVFVCLSEWVCSYLPVISILYSTNTGTISRSGLSVYLCVCVCVCTVHFSAVE